MDTADLEAIDENNARLDGCAGHDFRPSDVDHTGMPYAGQPMTRLFACSRCGGVADREAVRWYVDGLTDARASFMREARAAGLEGVEELQQRALGPTRRDPPRAEECPSWWWFRLGPTSPWLPVEVWFADGPVFRLLGQFSRKPLEGEWCHLPEPVEQPPR